MCEYCGNMVVEEIELSYCTVAIRPCFDGEYNAVCLATITGSMQGEYAAAAERRTAEHGGIGAWVMVVETYEEDSIHCVDFCPKCGRQLN